MNQMGSLPVKLVFLARETEKEHQVTAYALDSKSRAKLSTGGRGIEDKWPIIPHSSTDLENAQLRPHSSEWSQLFPDIPTHTG